MKRRSAAYKKKVESVAKAREAKISTGEPSNDSLTTPQPAAPLTTSQAAPLTTQHQRPVTTPQPSTSTQKVSTLSVREKLLSEVSQTSSCTATKKQNVVIGTDVLSEMFEATSGICDVCMARLELKIVSQSADAYLEVKCKQCDFVQYSSSPKSAERPTVTENNVNLVGFALLQGIGYAGYSLLTSTMNIKPLHRNAYYELVEYIGEKIIAQQEKKREHITASVFKHYENLGVYPDANGILNVTGSYDGSWLTRGHSSHIGIGCFIESETGAVLDYEVLSNYCIQCSRLLTKKKQKKITEEEYKSLTEKHKEKCQKNFDGKSGAMEAEAATRIWGRSQQLNKMRYVTFIGDGDSSAYLAVKKLNPYGNVSVQKEECINHVSKRLGARLRKLKDQSKGQKKKSLGGKGKLTDKVIERLPFDYGQAIRKNKGGTVEDLKKDIYATFYHCTSTDENPRHDLCPTGEKSWCFYQKALAQGKTPPSHKDMKIQFTLDPPERQQVFQIYLDLTKNDLLVKCMMGMTQNPNEALHSKIWSHLHKVKFWGLRTVQYSCAYTVLTHNVGYAQDDLNKELGFGNISEIRKKHQDLQNKKRRQGAAALSKPKRRRTVADAAYRSGEY